MAYHLGKGITGLGTINILAGEGNLQPARGKQVIIGRGTLTGRTENIPITVYLDQFKEVYFGMFLNKLFGGESIDKIMQEATKFVKESEDKLKERYEASKVDIKWSWQTHN